MFQRLGHITAKYRIPIIVAWIALAITLTLVAPDLEEVTSSDQKDFLPQDAPFVHAQEVHQRVFPEQSAASTSMVLVDAGPGGDVHDADVWAFIEKVETWLNSDRAPENVIQAIGPTTAPEFADKLIAPDRRIALVGVGLSTIADVAATDKAVNAIDDWLEANTPTGTRAYQSGEAALSTQAEQSALETMDRTLWITVILIALALLAIYRSPVSPLIPLAAVTMALIVTVGVVGLLAEAGVIAVLTEVQTILVAVMYGAGTDYCLFLISRFREEMADEVGVKQATEHTVHLVGETISSSAGTVFVGFTSLVFAKMGMFKSAGPMLAIGILTGLLAGLTLVPALLAALGNRAFWPAKARHRSSGRFYEFTSKLVSSRPLLTILIIAAVMIPFSVYGLSRDLNYDMVSELPEEIPSVKGYHLLQEHMGGGVLFPLTVVVTDRDPETMAAEIARLTDDLYALEGVTDVRGLHTPLGYKDETINNLLRVDSQLELLLSMDEEQEETPEDVDPQAVIESMKRYVNLVAERFPAVADDENLRTAQDILGGGMLGIMMRQNELLAAVERLAERFRSLDDAYLLPPAKEGDLFALLQPLYDEYIASDGVSYRLEVVLADPIGEGGFDTVNDIRNLLKTHKGNGEAVVSGFTVVYTDIRDIMNRDMYRAFGIVLAGIFFVLLLMLRSVVAPVYLIATVLLSFTCTWGLTSLFFDLAMDVERLSWLLPMFMFVFLVALGIDYSIFLFGRIKEEVGHHGIREGVHVAVARTGAIITSAGVILAGTFAGMMAGEIAFLKQLGFAVAVGVLIDTFIVRTVLDPALAALFGRWTWWPGGVPKAPTLQPSAKSACVTTLLILLTLAPLLSGCATEEPTPTSTPLPPTATPMPPTPIPTPVLPTATSTPVPPTATPTPIPPTPAPPTPTPTPLPPPAGSVQLVSQPFVNEAKGYRITYPDGWQAVDMGEMAIFVEDPTAMSSGAPTAIMVSADALEAFMGGALAGVSEEQLEAALLMVAAQLGEDFDLSEVESFTVGGFPAAGAEGRGIADDGVTPMAGYLTLVLSDAHAAMIMAVSPIEGWETFWPTVEAVLGTFAFAE